jgi:hypothetical protein
MFVRAAVKTSFSVRKECPCARYPGWAELAPVTGPAAAVGLSLVFWHTVDVHAAISDAARPKRGSAELRLPPILPAGATLRLATCEIIAIISGIRL